jgi:hypothetical protein
MIINSSLSRKGFGEQTPVGNTGFNDKQVRCNSASVTHHWIQGVAIVGDIQEFVDYLTRYNKSAAGVVWHWETPYAKGRVWNSHAVATNGARFAFSQLDGGMWDCWFSLPGEACEQMSVREQAQKITGLVDKYKAGFTRLDAKVRLPVAIAPIENFIEAHDKKDFKIAQAQGGVNYSFKSNGEKSYTVYFGSRQSEALTRVYDPEVCHGVLDATDIEVELKDGKAKEYAQLLTDLWFSGDTVGLPQDELARFIASVATSHVDFIDQTTATRRTNCKRWDWWQAILDYLDAMPIRLIPEKSKSTFEKFWAFCDRNVWKKMAAYAIARQDMDYVLRFVKNKIIEASNKLNPEHYALIDEYQFTQISQILS